MEGSDSLGEHRVFVGGVSWKVNDATLHSFFENNYGPVIECKLIMDKQTGKSKGYGFVTFANPETAAAVKRMGTIPLMGKNMNVGDAFRKGPGMGGGGGGGMRMQQAPMHHQGRGMGGRPGGLLDRPPHQGQSSPYGHQTAPPPSQPAYPSTQPPSGGVYQQSGGYYQDPYQMNTGGYYGSQWSHQQPAAPAHQAQSVYGYPAAAQQSGYGSYAGYQQPVAQQQGYSYPQQQQAWPQQQLQQQQPPQMQQQQMQQQQMQQQQIQQQAYGSYGM
jgi:hypothetical protein